MLNNTIYDIVFWLWAVLLKVWPRDSERFVEAQGCFIFFFGEERGEVRCGTQKTERETHTITNPHGMNVGAWLTGVGWAFGLSDT